MRARLIAAAALVLVPLAAQATVVIRDDRGGALGDYLARFAAVRDSGDRVVIDGRCYSACTIVIALVPAERICVTSRARLGFHAARAQTERLAVNEPATEVMMSLYPPPIKDWLARRGGLSANLLVLAGPSLRAIYRPCR
jgi:hypothetical protein